MSAVVSGLDVHKEYTYATVMSPDGEVVVQSRMPNEEVPAFLKPYRVERLTTEATTSIAPLYRKLTEERYNVTVSPPRRPGTSRKPASRPTGLTPKHWRSCSG